MSQYVGDFGTPTLTVPTFDGSTVATLSVVDPTGEATAVPVEIVGDKGHWKATSAYELTMPGEWLEHWTVTGTGKGSRTYVRTVDAQPVAPPGHGSHATTAQFYAYTGDDGPRPAALSLLLRRASLDVNRVLVTAVYTLTDADPNDAMRTIADVLADATCEQACYRIENGQESGINAGYHSVAIGSVNLTRGYTGAGSGAEGDKFSPQAWQILVDAGLTAQPAYTTAG